MTDRFPIEGFLTLTPDGDVYIVGDTLRKRLSHASGRYRLEGTPSSGLEFSKANEFKALRELSNPIMMSGRIERLKSIIDIVSLIAIAKYDANLIVVNGQQRYVISFLDGRIRNAQASDATMRLGEVIYRAGAITREELDKSLIDAQHFGRPIGNYLVEHELVSQSELLNFVEKQVRVIFQSTVSMQNGRFFMTSLDAELLRANVDLDTQHVLLDTMTKLDELQRIEDKLASFESCYIDKQASEQYTGLTPPMVHLLSELLQEPTATNELLFNAPGRRDEIMEALLALDHSGQLKFSGQDAVLNQVEPLDVPIELAEAKTVVRNFNECFQQLHAAAERRSATASLNTTLDTFLRFYGYSPLFDGVIFNDAGLLDEHRLLKNLRQLELETERVQYLERALHELLHFTLFAAREFLNRDEIRHMQQSLSSTAQHQARQH